MTNDKLKAKIEEAIGPLSVEQLAALDKVFAEMDAPADAAPADSDPAP